jgi:hypothetical protein
MDVRKIGNVLMILTVFFGFAFATTTATKGTAIQEIMGDLCDTINGLLPIFGFVLFVLAGVAYAAGQFFGAELRGRSMGWAMNMVVGAIIAFVLYALGPMIISAFYSNQGAQFGSSGCTSIAHSQGW